MKLTEHKRYGHLDNTTTLYMDGAIVAVYEVNYCNFVCSLDHSNNGEHWDEDNCNANGEHCYCGEDCLDEDGDNYCVSSHCKCECDDNCYDMLKATKHYKLYSNKVLSAGEVGELVSNYVNEKSDFGSYLLESGEFEHFDFDTNYGAGYLHNCPICGEYIENNHETLRVECCDVELNCYLFGVGYYQTEEMFDMYEAAHSAGIPYSDITDDNARLFATFS